MIKRIFNTSPKNLHFRTLMGKITASALNMVRKNMHITRRCWSIGIYEFDTIYVKKTSQKSSKPVLTVEDVTDAYATYIIADPFVISDNGMYYMFFEVLNEVTNNGEIAYATSRDGYSWKYKRIILKERFHMSYPYVFKNSDKYFMIPETYQDNSIRLYESIDFPTRWHYICNLLEGYDYVDPSIILFNGNWWLFVSTTQNDTLRLYFSSEIRGPWKEHPKSPLHINNKKHSRPSGRIVVNDDVLVRFSQDCSVIYGEKVYAHKIKRLTENEYEEELVLGEPIISPGQNDWNSIGMHNVDFFRGRNNQLLACVDGKGVRKVNKYSYRYIRQKLLKAIGNLE